MRQACSRHAAVRFFYLSHGLVRVFEIILSHRPVPSPVSCPVVSDDVHFKLNISNLKSLDIIHDALH